MNWDKLDFAYLYAILVWIGLSFHMYAWSALVFCFFLIMLTDAALTRLEGEDDDGDEEGL